MEKEILDIYEWRIQNFGCWNVDVHGDVIKSPEFSAGEMQFFEPQYIERLELWPRYGSAKNIMIICFGSDYYNSGNLSIIGADGSLIFTKRVPISDEEKYDCPELDFDKIAAKIKKEAENEDRLTVRLCFVSKKGYADTVSTTLDVSEISLNIDPKLLETIESGDTKNISLIHYNKSIYLDELLIKATRKDLLFYKGATEFVLHLLTKSTLGVLVQGQMILYDSDNNLVRNRKKNFLFQSCKPLKWPLPLSFSHSIKMSKLAEKDLKIVLNLKIISGASILENLKSSQEQSKIPKKTTICFFDQITSKDINRDPTNRTGDSVTALTHDLMCLYQDQKFSDLQLKCDNVTFPVHKTILGARSPVFERLLSTDMIEAATDTVDIADLEAPTLSHFLTFLYTGAVEDLHGERALKLYYAADKYQVPTLKKECADFLCAHVTLSNVCDILSLASKHQDGELTSAAHSFILENYSDVMASEKWKNFVKIEPLLAAEILTDFAAKSCVGKIVP